MNKKTTKKALLSSVMALLICCVMLIGTTFAWFTDTVTSGGNKIQSGTLNIDLSIKDGDDYTSVKESEAAIWGEDILWEPGYTAWTNVKVSTTGNLALEYTMKIVEQSPVAAADVDLAKVIDVYYASTEVEKPATRDLSGLTRIGTLREVIDASVAGTDVTKVITDTLIPAEDNTADYATIVLKMQESAGNEYQGKNIGSAFDIQIQAIQYTYEADSFDNQYDVGAYFYDVQVNDAAELAAAIEAGNKIIAVNGTVALTGALNASGVTFVGTTADSGIDFGTYGIYGSNITYKNLALDNDRNGWYEGMEYGNAANNTYENCTIVNGVTTYGNSTFKNCTFNELPASNYALFVYGGKNITVDGCTFHYGDRAIKIYNEGYTPDVTVNVSNTAFKASSTTVANKAMIEIDDTYMTSINVTVNNITIDGAIAAQGVYRIDDGALDTSTDKSKVTVDGVTTMTSAVVGDQTGLNDAINSAEVVEVELEEGTTHFLQ